MERPDDGCGATPVTAYAPAKRCVLLQFTWLSARCIYRPCRQATGSYRLPNSVCQSIQSRRAGDNSSPLRAADSLTSRAISWVTSRAQPSDVLKHTIRTGLLYCPSISRRMTDALSASASSTSRYARPIFPKSSRTTYTSTSNPGTMEGLRIPNTHTGINANVRLPVPIQSPLCWLSATGWQRRRARES